MEKSANPRLARLKSLEARILEVYETLTPGGRQLSEILLEHQMDLASYTAAELAARAGVSKATAARLFKTLGYENYGEAKRQIRALKNWGSPLLALNEITQPTELDLIARRHKESEINNIEQTFRMLGKVEVANIVGHLEKTKRVWIVGLRNGKGIANYLQYFLTMIKDDVRSIPQSTLSFAEDFASVEKGDVVFAISFRRRPKLLGSILKEASSIGAVTILVTDLSVSTSARHADHVIRCWCRASTIFDSYASAVAVLGFLLAALAARLGDNLRQRLERIETLHESLDELSVPR